ncbi:MAG: hypothetical protein ACI4VL_03940, partial [Bacilli bacterium]
MEEKDRKLTLEERLLLIQEIINNGGLYGVNELLNKLSNNKNQLSEPTVAEVPTKEPDTINKTDNSINSASIYASEALPLVKADLEEQKQRTREIEKQPMDETAVKTMVRERIPNPYSDSRTVIPENNE